MSLRADRLIDDILGYRRAKVLMAAAHLGCFERLESPRSAADVARKLGLDGRGTEILLDALAAMGYLRKDRGLYRNSPASSRHLVPGRPGYLGDNLRYQELIWDAWGDLRRCVERGGALRPLGYWLSRRKDFTREYIRGMDDISRAPAREIAEILSRAGARRMLDVGAGPGSYSAALLERNPDLTATLLDLPGTLRHTREIMGGRRGLSGRVRYRAGDYKKVSFGRGLYDAVLLSHITHDESPGVNRALIEKGAAALKPGGVIAIHDFVVGEKRTTPLFGALFSVHMLVYTAGGRTYTAREYRGWLEKAGFVRLRRRTISMGARNSTELMLGEKAV